MFEELIQFNVEINSIDVTDKTPKDITVNWKMYDKFDPKGEFWTDSNGLEMQKRNLGKREWDRKIEQSEYISNITQNYYPVTSAIAMRDTNGSKLQVTIMNDRT